MFDDLLIPVFCSLVGCAAGLFAMRNWRSSSEQIAGKQMYCAGLREGYKAGCDRGWRHGFVAGIEDQLARAQEIETPLMSREQARDVLPHRAEAFAMEEDVAFAEYVRGL